MKVIREVRKPTSPTLRKARGITKQAQWSQKQRMEVVQAYLALGNVMLVVAATGVPEDTVRKWKMTQWWKDTIDELKRSQKLQLSGKLRNILEKTVTQLEDRVMHGDYVWDKDTMSFDKRKPVNSYVLTQISNTLIDKQLILEKAAEGETHDEATLDIRLKKIRDEMIKFAKAKTVEGSYERISEVPLGTSKGVLDVEVVNRQEGSGGQGASTARQD